MAKSPNSIHFDHLILPRKNQPKQQNSTKSSTAEQIEREIFIEEKTSTFIPCHYCLLHLLYLAIIFNRYYLLRCLQFYLSICNFYQQAFNNSIIAFFLIHSYHNHL